MDMTFSLPLTGRTVSLRRSRIAVTPVTTTGPLRTIDLFVMAITSSRQSPRYGYIYRKGLTGECHACFLLISGSTCSETGDLSVAPLLYQGSRRANAKGRRRNC